MTAPRVSPEPSKGCALVDLVKKLHIENAAPWKIFHATMALKDHIRETERDRDDAIECLAHWTWLDTEDSAEPWERHREHYIDLAKRGMALRRLAATPEAPRDE